MEERRGVNAYDLRPELVLFGSASRACLTAVFKSEIDALRTGLVVSVVEDVVNEGRTHSDRWSPASPSSE